jgi:lipopolysaccharide transport system permease protein
LVFGQIAQISTDGLPQILFYLSGIILWNYFSECFTSTSKTFNENQDLFGKVYFPRLVMPISKVVSGLIKFCIQFLFFLGIYFFYLLSGYTIQPTAALLYFPIFVLIMAGLGLGSGIIFTALTAKYRDLNFLITFGVQLLMYATPVIYPVSTIPEKYKVIIMANPITAVVEGFRSAFLGSGSFDSGYLLYSLGFTLVVLLLGIVIFNRTEKTFMDTV